MAFVSERMPEEEKEKLTFPVFTQRDGSKPTLSRWLIDRERNAFVVKTKSYGGGAMRSQDIDHYVMSWNNILVGFFADPHLVSEDLPRGTMRWVVHDCKIPPELSARKTEVKQIIRDALDAKGFVHDRHLLNEVRVDFDDCD